MSLSKVVLNCLAGTLGLLALGHYAIAPLYQLLHLGVREHGPIEEDLDFYYTIIAQSLTHFGGALGIGFCLAGIACAFSTLLGFQVGQASRQRARLWFWYVPVFWFFLELLGRFQIQAWYSNHGLQFPSGNFLREFAPHLWWLAGVWLCTTPAILTGRGFFALLVIPLDPSPKPPDPSS